MANEKRMIYAAPIENRIASYLAENAYLNDTAQDALMMVGKWLEEAPAVLPQQGYWESDPWNPGFVRCSVCHDCIIYEDWVDSEKWTYCPHCGTKLKEF